MVLTACNSTLEPSLPSNVQPQALAFSVAHSHTLTVDQFGVVLSHGSEIPQPTDQDGNTIPLSLPIANAVAAGKRHACALSPTGTVHCWGDNTAGALGAHRTCPPPPQGSTTTSCVLGADILPTLPPVRTIAAGDDVTCAITRDDDEVVCWGTINRVGGSRVPALDPPAPVLLPDATPLVAERVIASLGTVCAIARDDGALWCWGDSFGTLPVRMPQTGVVDIALGTRHSCLIDDTGLQCWGDDRNAEVSGDAERARACGDGPCDIVEPLHLPLDAVRVVVGERHTCALLGDSSVACWGSNEVGQLGRKDAFLVGSIATTVIGVSELGAGFAHSCAQRSDGDVWCWGSTSYTDTEE